MAELQHLAAIVGLRKISAGDEVGKLQGCAAAVGQRNALRLAVQSHAYLAKVDAAG